jgi:hypothetical protein
MKKMFFKGILCLLCLVFASFLSACASTQDAIPSVENTTPVPPSRPETSTPEEPSAAEEAPHDAASPSPDIPPQNPETSEPLVAQNTPLDAAPPPSPPPPPLANTPSAPRAEEEKDSQKEGETSPKSAPPAKIRASDAKLAGLLDKLARLSTPPKGSDDSAFHNDWKTFLEEAGAYFKRFLPYDFVYNTTPAKHGETYTFDMWVVPNKRMAPFLSILNTYTDIGLADKWIWDENMFKLYNTILMGWEQGSYTTGYEGWEITARFGGANATARVFFDWKTQDGDTAGSKIKPVLLSIPRCIMTVKNAENPSNTRLVIKSVTFIGNAWQVAPDTPDIVSSVVFIPTDKSIKTYFTGKQGVKVNERGASVRIDIDLTKPIEIDY